jgi:hypothetical protein
LLTLLFMSRMEWLTHWTYILDETKTPLVIVACGSYSPITYLHLRMFGKMNTLLDM